MTSITLTVTGAKAHASVRGPLTSGMVGIPVAIEYDDAWSGLIKNLVCRCGQWGPDSGETRTVAAVENTAAVAHEVMKAGMYLYLGIEGYSPDGQLVMPTTWAGCGRILPGANAGADPSADPRLPIWAHLQHEIGQIRACLQEPPNEGGLTDAQISALNGMFRVCAYDSTRDYAGAYGVFRSAFGITASGSTPEKTLTGISVSYSGGAVAVGTALSALTGITVTAHYSDGTGETVTGYALSGTIAEGSNTVTVTYQGRTAVFTVTGVAGSDGEEEPATPLGVAWTEGILILDTKGTEFANATWVASDSVALTGKTEIRIHNDTGKLFTFQGAYYDADMNYVSGFKQQYVQGSAAYPSPLVIPIPGGCSYVRLSTNIRTGSESSGYRYYTELTYELA